MGESNGAETLDTEEAVLRVRRDSNPHNVASAIAHAVYAHKKVTIRAIGAAAVNQAVKATAIARTYVAQKGLDLSFRSGFQTVMMPNTETGVEEEISAVILNVLVS
jgi:stage V sporulation protein S